jgi:uncharacterized protein (TIGR02996 family)
VLDENDLLTAIERDPGDELAWVALADCLEENGELDRAELVRLREWLRKADREDPQRSQNEARLQQLLAAGVRPAGPRLRLVLEGETALELASACRPRPNGSTLAGPAPPRPIIRATTRRR